jgi:hypothetical protein
MAVTSKSKLPPSNENDGTVLNTNAVSDIYTEAGDPVA